jgi:hypothetical protein
VIEYSYEIGEGHIISLADLRRRLATISKGTHQWVVRILQECLLSPKGEVRSHALICYANPILIDMPNSLSFLFPIAVQAKDTGDEDGTFVCLHPATAVAASHGLYFEREELKQDSIEDWILFWSPLGRSLIVDSSNILVANELSLRVNGKHYKRVIFRFTLQWDLLGSSPDVVIADEPCGSFTLSDHFVVELKEDGHDWRKLSLAHFVALVQLHQH